jgi:hypothetical protein
MADPFREALNDALSDEFAAALGRIAHCLGQLSDAQIWLRSRADMNSIGNLVLHLNGNVRQLILSGIGGMPDDRNRPAEFAARDSASGEELLEQLVATVKQAREAILNASPETLCKPIPVTRYDYTGIQAVIRCIAHFRGHAQEIIHMTRTILGQKYQFAGPM